MKLHDDLLKERLWLELRRREELQFFVLSAASSTAATTSASKAKQRTDRGIVDVPRTPVDVGSLPRSEAEEQPIRAVASLALRESVLGIHDPDLVVNGAQYCVLEHVGRAREAGVLQNRLSKELGIDQRNLFHNLKHLKVRGIVRCQIVMLKEGKMNVKTNLIHLSRYAKSEGDDEQASSDLVVPEKVMRVVCDRLAAAKDQVLVEEDLRRMLALTVRRWRRRTGAQNYLGKKHRMRWATVRKKLMANGHVEYFSVNIDSKPRPCLRLLSHPFKDKTDVEEKVAAQELEEPENTETVLVSELPVDYQIYRLIDDCGAEGLTQTEVFRMSGLGRKYCSNRCRDLTKYYGVVAIPENVGRQVTYRLISPAHYVQGTLVQNLHSLLDDDEDGAGSEVEEGAASTPAAGGRKRKSVALSSVKPPTSKKPAAGKNGDKATPAKRRRKNDEPESHLQVAASGDSDASQPGPSGGGGGGEVELTNISTSPATTPAKPKLSTWASHKKRRPLTIQFVKRRQFLMDELAREKILVQSHLRRLICSHEEANPYELDSKSIRRIVRSLEKEQICSIIHVRFAFLRLASDSPELLVQQQHL
ncbi:uncharacterized protein ACA1_258840 [Acanthamoeba castellanii str. Neff]|uniref:Uncharacterized protein n=1 Tax=Acanthamoeba castellanii (strain ATCC 30010 / Neff) TaxID=1257118 RepID=L8GHG8_ACACF|nr:uncharacterized protein ACA1_258840 [Acanthamoeba castellanii str. Neff]ELR11611.1 hypothetical protein ACA1_258840 [Acanthamoeba castellanii str. Neff]